MAGTARGTTTAVTSSPLSSSSKEARAASSRCVAAYQACGTPWQRAAEPCSRVAQFAPFIRGAFDAASGRYDEQDEAVRALYEGTFTGTRLMTRAAAGSVQLFNGCRSLHRVLSPRGPRVRMSAVLSYDTREPCQQTASTEDNNVRLYGERVRSSEVWEAWQAARRQRCPADAPAEPAHLI